MSFMAPIVEVIDGHPFAIVHDCSAHCGDGEVRLLRNRSCVLPDDGRWTVTGPDEAATLDPSIVCEACGLHGYWRNGRWEPV